MSLGDAQGAQSSIEQAVRLAREQKQLALEASWLVESGKIALARGDAREADRLAQAALKIARPREHGLTVFRAEWLRHLVARRIRPDEPIEARVSLLRNLFRQLDDHEGVDEIVEFKNTILRAPEGG
jgi:hypothetical protein